MSEIHQTIQSRDSSRSSPEDTSEVPHVAEEFRRLPQDAEDFGKVPHRAERKEDHTLTVRETARIFEAEGVARTERSIINWCQPNRQGISRLDSYYDPNERKYYITPQSVEAAIQEEKHRSKNPSAASHSESFGSSVAHVKHPETNSSPLDARKLQELKWEILDLKITNRGKDYLIGELSKERKSFFEQLLAANRTMGQLEVKLKQLNCPEL